MIKQLLSNVTVFRGLNGVFVVTHCHRSAKLHFAGSDACLVQKAHNLDDMYSYGETRVKTIFAKIEKANGYYMDRWAALRAAKEKAGGYPLPNRRAAIAHTKAMS